MIFLHTYLISHTYIYYFLFVLMANVWFLKESITLTITYELRLNREMVICEIIIFVDAGCICMCLTGFSMSSNQYLARTDNWQWLHWLTEKQINSVKKLMYIKWCLQIIPDCWLREEKRIMCSYGFGNQSRIRVLS